MAAYKDPEKAGATRKEERAQRILNVAADLLQRWGYKKTTIDDIAREAGVAKGTIYLHWKTRDDLFLDLFMREKMKAAHQIQQDMENDPAGITLYSMIKYSILETLRNPVFKAVILRESEMLGDLTHKTLSDENARQQIEIFQSFLNFMREQGLLRTDQPLEEQIYLLEAVTLGFLTMDRLLPESLQISNEKKAELAAETIRRTLELRSPAPAEQQATSTEYSHMLDKAQEYLEKRGTGDGCWDS